MDQSSVPQENDGANAAGGELVIEPVKPKRASWTVKETERLLAALQVAIATDLDLMKREIIKRLDEVGTSVELIAGKLAGRDGD